MNQYYLMSQLPGLDGLDEKAPLPISGEEFQEVCSRFMSPKGMETLKTLSIVPDREGTPSGSDLVDSWNREERLLRLALGSVRASKMKKPFEVGDTVIPAQVIQAARTAVGLENPLAAEQFLNQYRMDELDKLRPLDNFCEDSVFYYGLKLMLLERMRKFDEKKGIASYQKIYDSILSGDNQES